MTREAILAIVVKHVAEAVEGLSVAAVDPALAMTDHGLSSLDIVDVVSRSQQVLQVAVPRAELRKARTINRFVDLLHQATLARVTKE